MTDATTVIEGYVPSTAPDAEPSLTGVASYLEGNRVEKEDYSNITIRTEDNQIENATVNYVDHVSGVRYVDKVETRFKPTNGLAFYKVLGKVTAGTANQSRTLTVWNVGTRKPTFHYIKKVGDLIPTVAYGCCMNELSSVFRPKDGWIFNMSGRGRKPDDTTSFTPETPTMPTYTGNLDSNNSFDLCSWIKWGAGTPTTAFTIVDYVEVKMGHGFLPVTHADEGHIKELTEMGNFITTVTMQVRGTTADVVALKADCANKTKRSFWLWAPKSSNSNHYFSIASTSNAATCLTLDYAHTLGNLAYLTATIVIPSPVVVVQDYVNNTNYTVPT